MMPDPQAQRKWIVRALFLTIAIAGAGIYFFQQSPKSGTAPEAILPEEPKPAANPQPAQTGPAQAPSSAAGLSAMPAKGSPAAQLLAQLLDEKAPLKTRRQAARALAKMNSGEALAAVKAALQSAAPYVKAALAEGFGENSLPQARELLRSLVSDSDQTVARGAIRGLGARGDAEAVETLSSVLLNSAGPESVRTEAALALGGVPQPAALEALLRAAAELDDDAITENVLEGLGKRPFSETTNFFRDFLQSPKNSSESKVTAVEALGSAQGEVAPLLLQLAGDRDADIRAAAAWALISAESESDLGRQIFDLLKQEASPEVRARLYQALANQESYDVPAVLALIRNESDPAARSAGFDLLAQACRSAPTPELLEFFNLSAVAELKQMALGSDNPQNRLASVMTLRRSGTPAAMGALHELALASTDPRIVAAAKGASLDHLSR